MGLAVEVVHETGGSYFLRVNHPEVTAHLEFRCWAIAQAVQNFLVEFEPHAFVPRPESVQVFDASDPRQKAFMAALDGLSDPAPIPTEEELAARAPHAVADADDNVGGLLAGSAIAPEVQP